MTDRVTFKPYKSQMDYLLKQPQGVVGRHLFKKATMIREMARMQVGFKTGALYASISVSGHERTMTGQSIRIGSTLPYAHMHHEGTRPHMIAGQNGGMLRYTRGGRVVYSRAVMHPGTRPNRYLSDNLIYALT
jgi:hypothetical protein